MTSPALASTTPAPRVSESAQAGQRADTPSRSSVVTNPFMAPPAERVRGVAEHQHLADSESPTAMPDGHSKPESALSTGVDPAQHRQSPTVTGLAKQRESGAAGSGGRRTQTGRAGRNAPRPTRKLRRRGTREPRNARGRTASVCGQGTLARACHGAHACGRPACRVCRVCRGRRAIRDAKRPDACGAA